MNIAWPKLLHQYTVGVNKIHLPLFTGFRLDFFVQVDFLHVLLISPILLVLKTGSSRSPGSVWPSLTSTLTPEQLPDLSSSLCALHNRAVKCAGESVNADAFRERLWIIILEQNLQYQNYSSLQQSFVRQMSPMAHLYLGSAPVGGISNSSASLYRFGMSQAGVMRLVCDITYPTHTGFDYRVLLRLDRALALE